jgi:hypothetical protein
MLNIHALYSILLQNFIDRDMCGLIGRSIMHGITLTAFTKNENQANSNQSKPFEKIMGTFLFTQNIVQDLNLYSPKLRNSVGTVTMTMKKEQSVMILFTI